MIVVDEPHHDRYQYHFCLATVWLALLFAFSNHHREKPFITFTNNMIAFRKSPTIACVAIVAITLLTAGVKAFSYGGLYSHHSMMAPTQHQHYRRTIVNTSINSRNANSAMTLHSYMNLDDNNNNNMIESRKETTNTNKSIKVNS